MVVSFQAFSVTFLALVLRYYPELGEYKPRTVPAQQVDKGQFDFIIVGAGTAGSVLASRLSEETSWKVLLLEAGGDETPISKTPLMHLYIRNSPLDWNYTTVKQHRACQATGGICAYTRGRALGGSSSINGMVYCRGNKNDYDNWKYNRSLDQWGHKDVLPYFLRSEDMKEESLASSPYHRRGGPLSVQYPRYSPAVEEDIIRAGEEIGMIQRDYNGEKQSGIGRTQFTINGAQRWSASSAFLTPASNRSNLSIVKNVMVNRILIEEQTKRAYGVEYSDGTQVFMVNARKEVILSAGAINTPKLMMLSGIGPSKHLKDLGIPLVADLPVGENLQDHAQVRIPFKLNGRVTLSPDVYFSNESSAEFAQNKTGSLTTSALNVMGFLSPGANLMAKPPSVQFITFPFQRDVLPANESYMNVLVSSLRPKSTGTVRLSSPKPDDPPLIDPNYFSAQEDIDLTVAGLQEVTRLMASPSMAKYSPTVFLDTIPQCKDSANNQTALYQCLVLFNSRTLYHSAGTAKMGKKSAGAVVNPHLQVYGVPGLRVVDASVMPTITSGNTNAPVIMIAEKAADIIKKFYLNNI